MSKPLLAVVAAVALLAAGCVSSAPSGDDDDVTQATGTPPKDLSEVWADRLIHQIREIQPISVTASDGVTLNGHVYLPDVDGPVPTILEYSPYFNGHETPTDAHVTEEGGRRTMTGNHAPLLEAGFAVALVNVRGTGTSDGCVLWGAEQDIEDVTAVIDAISKEPWSDGQVGMVGTSYPGWTQYMAMAGGHPALKAVIPVSGLFDLHSLLSRYGAPLSISPVVTTQWHALYSLGEATYAPGDPRAGEVKHADCGPRAAEDAAASAELYAVGDRTPYWQARDLRSKLAESDVPILFTNGLTDGEGHILKLSNLFPFLIPRHF